MSIEPFIKCSHIQNSIMFYTEVLDFAVRTPPNPDPTSHDSKHAMLERGGDAVHLSSHSGDSVFGTLIYIRVSNVDELYEQFLNNGMKPFEWGKPTNRRTGPVNQSWNMREFGVADPDGNIINFGQELIKGSET